MSEESFESHQETLRILAFGDVVAKAGKAGFRKAVVKLKERFSPDLVIVNAENVCGGVGIDAAGINDLYSYGAHVITLGDHSFKKKGSEDLLRKYRDSLARPANFPISCSGTGYVIKELKSTQVAVVNMMGRVFMNPILACPFKRMEKLLENELKDVSHICVDFHAEATSEKAAFGRSFDGRISLMWGTHTHIQTADAQILPRGTGYITDLGMCGPSRSVIGMDVQRAIARFETKLPIQYKPGTGDALVGGVFCELNSYGCAVSIESFAEYTTL